MKLIRGLHNVCEQHHKAVVTIGNFDGMHRGHQAILKRVMDSAKARGVPSILISFEPQPLEFFSSTPPARLARLREKYFCLERFGVDYFLCLPFNKKLAQMSAPDFVQKVLLDLKVSEVIVGDDFKFGKARSGDAALLKSMGLNVQQLESQLFDSERVSSTLVRAVLQAGDLKRAENFLGRPYSMVGRVVHGAKLGRQWGIPTANIFLHRHVSPISGIFAVKMHGLDRVYKGVANIGTRPTVDGAGRVLLEVHLFDFDADIYGRLVEVEFCAKRRDEERYDSVDVLIAEIKKDMAWAHQFFNLGP